MAQRVAGSKKRKGKSNRKHGNNLNFCLRYRNERRRERNKKRKLVRHLKAYPNDRQAAKALAKL